MHQPSVTKEFKNLVAPDFIAIGFAADGRKHFRRVVGDVFQGIFIHVETRIRREFMIEYCAFLICVPQTHHTLEHGGRFPVGSQGHWYWANTPEQLEQSMTRVRASAAALLDWFRASESLDGFLSTFSAHLATQPPRLARNGHAAMTLACGYAAMGDSKTARRHAQQALGEFEGILASFHAQYPNATHWAPEYIERTRTLVAAIDSSTTEALLTEWRGFTTDALKLPS